MTNLHIQYIKDTAGQNLVILPQDEFESLLSELEELQDIKSYDEAKKNDNKERIPMNDVFQMIEQKRKK